MERAQHWAVLSLARFLLAVVVLVGHIYCQQKNPSDWSYFGLWLNQGSAVFGFLIISGYSIGASIERSEKGFYGRRFIRIWPIYLLSLMLALTIGSAGSFQIVASLLMLQGIVAAPIAVDGQLWTLALEWWLYMATPVFKRLPSAVLAMVAACSLAINIVVGPADASKLLHGESLVCLAWYWLVGFLYYRHRRTTSGYLILFFPIGALLVSGTFMGRAALIGLLAVVVAPHMKVPGKVIAPLTWLGDLSYPLYCVHGPFLAICLSQHIHSSGIMIAAVVAVSAISLHCVDLPIRRGSWKAFFRPIALVRMET